MKETILEMLLQSNTYISGETLSHELGVSRTAIWKAINKLKAEGYSITSVRNKGYLLVAESSDLNEDGIRVRLNKESRFRHVKVLDEVDSTITEAKRLKLDGTMDEGLILAQAQTAGKGRRGRSWISDNGKGIWSSLLLKPQFPPQKASMLTLLAGGVAVVDAIKKVTDLEAKIKWPNDVVVEGKKVCGILTEMSAELDYIHYVVVGIGINVNQDSFDDSISSIATSLSQVSREEVSRFELLIAMVEAFEALYERFHQDQSLAFIIDKYNSKCINIGMDLKIEAYGDIRYGKGVKVDVEGKLLVEGADGYQFEVNAGEVSVRGLYGYAE